MTASDWIGWTAIRSVTKSIILFSKSPLSFRDFDRCDCNCNCCEEMIEVWRIEWTRRTLKKWRIKLVMWRARWNWTPPRRSDSIRNVRLVMGRKDWWLAKEFKSIPQKSVSKIEWIGELGCTATFSSIIRLKMFLGNSRFLSKISKFSKLRFRN